MRDFAEFHPDAPGGIDAASARLADAQLGLALPDTPVMALHRGRIDLLAAHLDRDPDLLHRTFRHREIYPSEMGCADPIDATVGTPLDGTSLPRARLCQRAGDASGRAGRWGEREIVAVRPIRKSYGAACHSRPSAT